MKRSGTHATIQSRLHIAIMAETAAIPDADSETMDGELSRIIAPADPAELGRPDSRPHTPSSLITLVMACSMMTVGIGVVVMAIFVGGVVGRFGLNLLVPLANLLVLLAAASWRTSLWLAMSCRHRKRRSADAGEILRFLRRNMIVHDLHRDDDRS